MGKFKLYFLLLSFLLLGVEAYLLQRKTTERSAQYKAKSIETQEKVKSSYTFRNTPDDWYEDKTSSYPLPNLKQTFPILREDKLVVELKIEKVKIPQAGNYWCGAPFYVDYEGEARAKILSSNGLILDELELSSPTLVLGKPPDYDFYYYKPYDLDGDGEKREFILLEYFSCNGNFLKVIKVDKNEKKFKTLPFKLEENIVEKVLVDPQKEDFGFGNGRLWTKSYDMLSGKFYKSIFYYKDGVFVRKGRLEEGL